MGHCGQHGGDKRLMLRMIELKVGKDEQIEFLAWVWQTIQQLLRIGSPNESLQAVTRLSQKLFRDVCTLAVIVEPELGRSLQDLMLKSRFETRSSSG